MLIINFNVRFLYSDEVKVKAISQISNSRFKDLVWFIQSKWNNGSDYMPDDIENKNIENNCLKSI